MRTTLDLDDQLLSAAKRQAAQRNTTLTAFVEHALAAALASRPPVGKPFQLQWKTRRGKLVAGVDITDRDRLFDAMDGRR